MSRGRFITVEGPEGSGKSTHSRLLCLHLKKSGFKVLQSREPGGTKIGEAVRKVLLDKKNKGISGACELFLFLAALFPEFNDTFYKGEERMILADSDIQTRIMHGTALPENNGA